MGMIMDLVKSLADMKKLSSLTEAIEGEMNTLESEGKLPDELKNAFQALKDAKSNGGNVEDSLKPLQDFVAMLEKYEDLFPENIKNIVAKVEGVEKDLEGIANNIDTVTGNK